MCIYPLRCLLVPISQTTVRNRIEQLVTYVLCLALHIAWNQHDGGDMVALKEIPITESDLSQDMFELDMTASIWSDLEPMTLNVRFAYLTCRLEGNGPVPSPAQSS